MRGSVKRIYNGIPAALKAVPKAGEIILDTLGGKLLVIAKKNIRDQGLIDTGAMRNSGYLETSRSSGARLKAQQASLAAAAAPGEKSGKPHPMNQWATPSRAPNPGEAKAAFAAEYAVYWELGFLHYTTTYIGPTRLMIRPFLGPAAEDLKKTASADAKTIFDKVIGDALR